MSTESRHNEVDIWKSWAIIAVVIIHALSYLYDHWYFHRALWQSFVVLDQLLRFSVPLFIFASGLTLTWKYADKLNLRAFYSKRLFKVIPLYLLWSGIIILVLNAVPDWSGGFDFKYLLPTLLRGQADYHLYFVALIFQFYLLFPLLLFLTRKFNWLFLGLALVIQLFVFKQYFLGHWSDQQEYVLFVTWIFYFVLGIFIGLKKPDFSKLKSVVPISLILILIFTAWQMLTDSFSLIDQRLNLNMATEFTRSSVVVYASFAIFVLVSTVSWLKRLPDLLKRFFIWLGRESFLIYLCHTLILRIIFDHWFNQHDPLVLVWVSLIVSLGIVASKVDFRKLRD